MVIYFHKLTIYLGDLESLDLVISYFIIQIGVSYGINFFWAFYEDNSPFTKECIDYIESNIL
jgi:hypothetical protein